MTQFKARADGTYMVDPGPDYNHMLLFPRGRPSNYRIPQSERASSKAPELTEWQMRANAAEQERELKFYAKKLKAKTQGFNFVLPPDPEPEVAATDRDEIELMGGGA